MRPTVLAYHTVVATPPESDPHGLAIRAEVFEAQLDVLARTRTVVSLEDVVEGRATGAAPAVAITFDDGYRGVLEVAAPLLSARGFPATIFVPTGHLGARNRWDDLDDPAFRILGADELRALEDLGVSVESHGHRHISYFTSAPDEVRTDIATSSEILEGAIGRRPRFLAYPFGPSARTAREEVRLQGFRAAFSVDAPHRGDFEFGRLAVQVTDGPGRFRAKTSGWYVPLRMNPVVAAVANGTRSIRRRVSG